MKVRDFNIGVRLGAVLAAILLIAAALLATSLFSDASNRSTLSAATRASTQQIGFANEMQLSLLRAALAVQTIGLQSDVAGVDSSVAEAKKERTSFQEARQQLEARGLSPEEQSMLSELDGIEKENLKHFQNAVGLAQQFNTEEASSIITKKIYPLNKKALSILATFIAKQKAGADTALQAVEAQAGRTLLTIASVGMVALILAVFAGLVLTRSIVAPMRQAGAITEQVAAGDLSALILIQGKDETAQLLASLHTMQASLVQVVSNVRAGSESVSTASAEIAQGNSDLSARTESQASALEQTAASMEQLAATVKQNSDNALQANQLALSASRVAAEGGQVVSQVVDTMRGISGASKKIADIINVIDGIAFQTNILALNAAVEAARAGEQGRGFAVVASEVRSLAGRSADAAKEIKQLITDSVERVDKGTLLVDKAGSTMNEVVSSIKRVTDIMGEISAASTEQSLGVAQVGEAVTQMDQATQQNAALVEEIAAAASSLSSQAKDLVQAVAVFKLNDDTGHVPSTSNRLAAARAPLGLRSSPPRLNNTL